MTRDVAKRYAFVVPGDLTTLTGGYVYDRNLVSALEDLGWQVRAITVPGGWPDVDNAVRAHAQSALASIAPGTPTLVDGLALGVLPDEANNAATRLPLIGLVHHPLALEAPDDIARASRLRESERRALAACRRVVCTSATTARTLLKRYDVPSEHISVARPGTEPRRQKPAPRISPPGGHPNPFRLLCVASLIPRKGLLDLLDALNGSPDTVHLDLVGSDRFDPVHAAQVREKARTFGKRVRIHGEVESSARDDLYAHADLFVLPSHYEGYGMAFAEALAAGLPIIGTTGGAIPEVVPENAGILVEPGDVEALRQALSRAVSSSGDREIWAAAARQTSLPTWSDAAETVAAALGEAALSHEGFESTPRDVA